MLKTDTKDELLQKKAVLASKINGVEQLSMKGIKRAERAKKMALDGLIEVEEYKSILDDIKKSDSANQKKADEYRKEIRDIDRLVAEERTSLQKILTISDQIDEYGATDEGHCKAVDCQDYLYRGLDIHH